jgi:hypothetical protein
MPDKNLLARHKIVIFPKIRIASLRIKLQAAKSSCLRGTTRGR